MMLPHALNSGDYHLTYLKWDVLLLADVVEKNGRPALATISGTPQNYMTTPSLAWDTMLLNTDIKLGSVV